MTLHDDKQNPNQLKNKNGNNFINIAKSYSPFRMWSIFVRVALSSLGMKLWIPYLTTVCITHMGFRKKNDIFTCLIMRGLLWSSCVCPKSICQRQLASTILTKKYTIKKNAHTFVLPFIPNDWQHVKYPGITRASWTTKDCPDNKVHVAHMGPTWVLSAPGRHRVGPMNFVIRVLNC